MSPSIWQILIIAIVILVLFGRGRISEMMGDFGKGISSFKKGINEGAKEADDVKAQIEAPAPTPAPTSGETTETTSGDTTRS